MLIALALLTACTPSATHMTIHAPEGHVEVFEDFVAYTDHGGLSVEAGDDVPAGGIHVVLLEDLGASPGGYRVDREGHVLEVHGADVLGLQYGLADVLESVGFRFLHPHRTRIPTVFDGWNADTGKGKVIEPEVDERRGLHLHTLHPVEGLYDFWLPDEGSLDRAKRTIDWVVKNRGNHVQWVALDDIERLPGLVPAWREHTTSLIDYAHARGVTVGLGVQLFGSSNLQQAFDLTDAGELDPTEATERLELLLDTDPDMLNLSFGEFSGEEPETFVQSGNEAVALMQGADPEVEVTSVIHVGNYDDLRVTYEGDEQLYYFLADEIEGATPWIHTVMYYNLFDDAGLAYLHEEFDEHRAFLLDALTAGREVGYFPESAYWVAFDINVPTYLPVYARSRFVDLEQIRAGASTPLRDHVLFSSGWEWGYWLNDVVTLRMNHTLPDTWDAPIRDLYAPWGHDGEALADGIVALGELQHEALIADRLAPWLAGREAIIDLGDQQGIVSQPDRPQYAEIQEMSAAELAELDLVAEELAKLSDATWVIHEDIDDLGAVDRWFEEVRDGVEVDALRAAFARHLLASAVALARDDSATAEAALVEAEQTLDEAAVVVDRRHADLHWTGGDRILAPDDDNPTIYGFGYLEKADTLCFWERERRQVVNLVRGEALEDPLCI